MASPDEEFSAVRFCGYTVSRAHYAVRSAVSATAGLGVVLAVTVWTR